VKWTDISEERPKVGKFVLGKTFSGETGITQYTQES